MKCSSPTKIKLDRFSYKKVATVAGLGIVAVPCGTCNNCRINQSRIWRNRILLEQVMHGCSCFVTLTYDDRHIPDPAHLSKVHLQKYIKRLRYYVKPIKIRYFAVGEYGDASFRPHYHIVIFGLDPVLNEPSIKKAWLYAEPDIGIHIGELNKRSASYITGYITKKILKKQKEHPTDYGKTDEFMLCSNGLGKKGAIKIAKTLKKDKHWNEKKKQFKVIKRGKTHFPLGRYLVEKANEILQTPDNIRMIEFWKNQQLEANKPGKEKKYKQKGFKL